MCGFFYGTHVKNTKNTDRTRSKTKPDISINTEKGKIDVFFYEKDIKVIVNGQVYIKPGDIIETIRVAPVKYTESHFREVDERISYGMYAYRACEEVAAKYDFSFEGFYRQYRDRHLNKKGKL